MTISFPWPVPACPEESCLPPGVTSPTPHISASLFGMSCFGLFFTLLFLKCAAARVLNVHVTLIHSLSYDACLCYQLCLCFVCVALQKQCLCLCLLHHTLIRFATLHTYRSWLTSLRTNLNVFPFKMFQTEYLSHERSKINLKAQKISQERDSIVCERHVWSRR